MSLELGGKSPNIVFPDADLDEAVNGSLFAIFTNAGQRCTARTRLFLHRDDPRSIHLDFVPGRGRSASAIPLDDDTQMGPVISPKQRDRVITYCEIAREDGAELSSAASGHDCRTLRGQLRRADRFRQCALGDATRPGRGLRPDSGGDPLRD